MSHWKSEGAVMLFCLFFLGCLGRRLFAKQFKRAGYSTQSTEVRTCYDQQYTSFFEAVVVIAGVSGLIACDPRYL